MNPLFAIDFYKADHRRQYPEGTTEVYSNFTPRYVIKNDNMLDDFDNKVVMFGLNYVIQKFLIETWDEHFFKADKSKVVGEYKERMQKSLCVEDFDVSHIKALHDLGYLPLMIKALPEGARVPIGVPVLTIVNTHPDFFWLTNYVESVLSAYLWKPITTATTAFEFRRLLEQYAKDTCDNNNHVAFQCHDFSFRGMSGYEDACINGSAHLTSFSGTDSVGAIELLEKYYDAEGAVGYSVPATEHSCHCVAGPEGEREFIKRLITEIYPTGIVSIVCDTYDYWNVITNILPSLKDEIMVRDGKVVVRPDSGNPNLIINGDPDAPIDSPEYKGTLQLLSETFGYTYNKKGYIELDSHIGLIYGDGITIKKAEEILRTMEDRNFASSNIIFGVGSYTYNYVTRDTFGFAMKATSAVVNGERIAIFKDPKTGSSKKSAKGLLRVDLNYDTDKYELADNISETLEKGGSLEVVFLNGNSYYPIHEEIISRIDHEQIRKVTALSPTPPTSPPNSKSS